MFSVCICDDDHEDCKRVKNMLDLYSSKKGLAFGIHEYTDSTKLCDMLESNNFYNFYFLDILMPLASGLDIAKKIRSIDRKAHIIFLTSSTEYALESYEFHADHYLVKPVNQEKMFEILDIIFSDLSLKSMEQLSLISKKGSYTISYDSIIYIEARRNIVSFNLNNSDVIDYYKTLTETVKFLSKHREFIRIHRSYIINMNYIRSIVTKQITLTNGQTISISETYADSFKKSYLSYLDSLSR